MPARRSRQIASRKAISVYVEEPIFKELEDTAIKERRSISNQMVVLIEEALQSRRRNRMGPK